MPKNQLDKKDPGQKADRRQLPNDGELLDTPTPDYVKARRKRRIVGIGAIFASAGVATMVAIAFLGDNFGNFTIRVNEGVRGRITMSSTLTSSDSEVLDLSNQLSYLSAEGFAASTLIDCDKSLPLSEDLDCEMTLSEQEALTAKKQEKGNGSKFAAYTFYVKNVSGTNLAYDYTLYTTEVTQSTVSGSASLERFVRVRVYENEVDAYTGDTTHDCVTYAWSKSTPNEDGNFEEGASDYVGNSKQNTSDSVWKDEANSGYCVNFEEEQDNGNFTVFTKTKELEADAIVRYTVVIWLEGNDPDNSNKTEPLGASILLGFDFEALNDYDDEDVASSSQAS